MKSQEQKRMDSGFHQTGLKSALGKSPAPNLIGEGIKIHGTYLSPKDAFIEGIIEGGVEVAGKLILGATGIIKGNVIADEIIVCGTVEGDLQSKNKTTMKDTARVRGNIYTTALVVEEDAVVEGEIYMSEKGSMVHPYQEHGVPEREMALIS